MVALRKEDEDRERRSPARLRVVTPTAFPPRVRIDALPEHTDYRDTGCEISASCLECPLARCKYDEPGGARALTMAARDREIALLRRKYQAPIDLLSSTYGVSRRTIFRVLAEARERDGSSPGLRPPSP